jgi:2-polyprenyl-6-methoxyphenol hydroxylase-like FAD-dependent oxidoreductase
LHRVLLHRLNAATLHTGHRATQVATENDAATVTFQTSSGAVSATADLVVVADGVNSGLRATLFPDYPGPDYAGYTVWRGLVTAPSPAVPALLSETWARGARFGVALLGDAAHAVTPDIGQGACLAVEDADNQPGGQRNPRHDRPRRTHTAAHPRRRYGICLDATGKRCPMTTILILGGYGAVDRTGA